MLLAKRVPRLPGRSQLLLRCWVARRMGEHQLPGLGTQRSFTVWRPSREWTSLAHVLLSVGVLS